MAIAVDQTTLGVTSDADLSSASVALTTSAAVASGGKIILAVAWFSASVTLSSVSGGGLTWSIDLQARNGSENVAIVSADAPAGLASGTTLTANFSAACTGHHIGASSYTGVGTAEASSSNGQASTANWTSGNIVAASAGDLIIAAQLADSLQSTSTPSAPSIENFDHSDATENESFTCAYRIEASPGTYSVAGTWLAVPSGNQITVVVAYTALGGGSLETIGIPQTIYTRHIGPF